MTTRDSWVPHWCPTDSSVLRSCPTPMSYSPSSRCAALPFHHSSRHSPPTIPTSAFLPLRPLAPPVPLRPSHLHRAKFEKFRPSDDASSAVDPQTSQPQQQQPQEEGEGEGEDEDEDEDSDLPTDLEDAVRQAGRAAASFVSSGGMRAIVELLIPQFLFLDEEGAQAEMWEYSRIFVETLIEEVGDQRVKAIFPDAGAAALLNFQWKDATFGFSSLSDRRPVDKEDEIVVMILPDYQMLEYVEKIASSLSDDPPRPLIMWNPRLVSEDVGVGFNVRKLRRYFLSTFTTVYSMRPLPSGSVFRCYPGMWKVFYDDKDRPNRYKLAQEQPSRPDATELELIFGSTFEKSDEPSLLDKVGSAFSSLNRFMKVISR